MILVAEVEELSGDPKETAEGFVVESHLDSKRGISATLVITNGTIEKGTFVVSGNSYCPIRFIENYLGEKVASATLSQPVVITGWDSIPRGGELFTTVSTKNEAEEKISKFVPSIKKEIDLTEDSGKLIVPIVVEADAHGTLGAVIQDIRKSSLERVCAKRI